MIQKISRIVLVIFYVGAGFNHFINPQFYHPLIPDYIPMPEIINFLSGIAEIVLGLFVFFPKTRRLGVMGIIAMLIAFIPSHIYFIQLGSCVGDLCVPAWVGWLRLVIIHPLLIYWVYSVK